MNEHRLRTILLVLAVYHLLLGALMLFAPGAFYDTLGKFPPENHHYIKDVSTFYIALGVVFFVSVRRRSWRTPVLAFSALEYGLHAINHLVDLNKASSSVIGWVDFIALSAIALFLAGLASFAWSVRQDEPVPQAGEQPLEPRT
jgi:hypothetical protein